MNRKQIMSEVQEIFREVFDDETIVLNEELTAEDIEDWDSLEHINLIMQIESQFNIKFEMHEVAAMQNVGDTLDFIEQKIK